MEFVTLESKTTEVFTVEFVIEEFAIKEFVASIKALVKKSQGIIPASTKRVKFGISTLKTIVKIKLMLIASINGVTIAHQIPSLEPAYFALSCKAAISRKAWRWEYKSFNLFLNIFHKKTSSR